MAEAGRPEGCHHISYGVGEPFTTVATSLYAWTCVFKGGGLSEMVWERALLKQRSGWCLKRLWVEPF